MKHLLVHVCLLLVLGSASSARLRSNGNGKPSSRKPPPAAAYPSYECVQGLRCERVTRPRQSCSRQRLPADSTSSNSQQQQQQQQQHHVHASLQACRLVCGKTAGLWPLPTGRLVLGSNYLAFHPRNLQFIVVNDQMSPAARDFVSVAVDAFLDNIRAYCNVGGRNRECRFPPGPERSIRVHVKVESSAMRLDWRTNESYELEIDNKGGGDLVSVLVTAQTVYGARHALETLSQLVAARPATNCEDDGGDDSTSSDGGGSQRHHHELVMLDEANVKDKPVFAHRGLLVDTGRNFLPLESLLRTVDALAANKMNVLHWHATDSQSFPLELKSVPLMSLWGAYDADKIYTRRDMEAVVSYARSRGVRVILEIDSPSHAGAGWQWGPSQGLGNLAVCVDQQPWRDYCIQPPCGQLNPVNPNTYSVLRSIYRELLDVFGRAGLAHLGGDELFVKCWNSTAEVVQGMARMGLGREPSDFLEIWSQVHKRQLEMLNEDVAKVDEEEADGSVILWSSQLTQPETIERYLDKRRFVVQTWVEAGKDLNERLLELGYRLVISTKDAWYLDHGFWGATKYHSWRDAYRNRIPQRAGVLGGEACMWGEYVNEGNLQARVWPRAAAVAERLWADPDKLGPSQATAEAEPRLQAQIARLKSRGVQSESLAPEWCNQHETQCY
ncbi:hypothetical protein TKK_0018478 [Trichogramma kaykai]|uniref:Beta-hexosaminidase n=1 Tax=Trichogramma kaykai TaxID=54128 RepID=A0ABD2VYK3_9HYME